MSEDGRKNTIERWRRYRHTTSTDKICKLTVDGVEPAASAEKLARAVASHDITARPERQTREGWQTKQIKDLLPIAFPPDGRPSSNLALKAIKAILTPEFEKRGLKAPSTDSIARALGRRNRRG